MPSRHVTYLRAVPALPVADVRRSADWYFEQLGFTVGHFDETSAVMLAGDATVHLRQAPVGQLAGTASCRIEVNGIDALFTQVQPRGILHHASTAVTATGFGTREFHVSDPDGNLVTFAEWSQP